MHPLENTWERRFKSGARSLAEVMTLFLATAGALVRMKSHP